MKLMGLKSFIQVAAIFFRIKVMKVALRLLGISHSYEIHERNQPNPAEPYPNIPEKTP